LTTLSNIFGMTMTGGDAADSVINNKLVIASLDLSGGANVFETSRTRSSNPEPSRFSATAIS